MPSSPQSAARTAKRSPTLRAAARLGYLVNGILNIAIGVLAIAVAMTGASGSTGADPAGALEGITEVIGGQMLIWLIALGLFALALWQIVEALTVTESDGRRAWASRARFIGKAIAYLALAVLAVRIALGGATGDSEESLTATALSNPGGVFLVIAAGMLALGVGGYMVVKGAKRGFLDDIRPPTGRARTATVVVGVAGYIARGIAIAVIGILFIAAAVTADASRAGGLDDSLSTLAGLPFGQAVLVVIGLGFIAYGIYCGVRARYAKL